MNAPEHTPGPWDFCCDSYGKVRHSRKAAVIRIDPAGRIAPIDVAQRIANWKDARLIAAAPTMLEALEAVVTHLANCEDFEAAEAARAAIAAARGTLENE